MPRPLLVVAVVLASALCSAAPAAASSVKIDTFLDCKGSVACQKYAGGQPAKALAYAAAPGEINAVDVAPVADGMRVRDPGAVIEAGTGCRRVDDHEAVCELPDYAGLDLGDGNDTATAGDVAGLSMRGGPGDDVLTGGPRPDKLDGGPGRDEVRGGAGADVLTGSPDGEPADALDGGADVDRVSYAGRKAPAIVLLDAAAVPNPSGFAPTDALTAVEQAIGGDGDDVIAGSAAADVLDGAAGDDTILGGAGRDVLTGGPGEDELSGGAASDRFIVNDGSADHVACGAGRDLVAGEQADDMYGEEIEDAPVDRSDVLALDCERVMTGDVSAVRTLAAPVTVRRRVAVLANPCGRSRRCRTTVTLRAGAAGGRSRIGGGPATIGVRLRGGRVGTLVRVRLSGSRSGGWVVDRTRIAAE